MSPRRTKGGTIRYSDEERTSIVTAVRARIEKDSTVHAQTLAFELGIEPPTLYTWLRNPRFGGDANWSPRTRISRGYTNRTSLLCPHCSGSLRIVRGR